LKHQGEEVASKSSYPSPLSFTKMSSITQTGTGYITGITLSLVSIKKDRKDKNIFD
jgi:hypothetical protein